MVRTASRMDRHYLSFNKAVTQLSIMRTLFHLDDADTNLLVRVSSVFLSAPAILNFRSSYITPSKRGVLIPGFWNSSCSLISLLNLWSFLVGTVLTHSCTPRVAASVKALLASCTLYSTSPDQPLMPSKLQVLWNWQKCQLSNKENIK